MGTPLVPCPVCSRHVMVTEARCPFCDAPLGAGPRARRPPAATRRLSRAGTLLLSTIALTCSGSATVDDETGEAAGSSSASTSSAATGASTSSSGTGSSSTSATTGSTGGSGGAGGDSSSTGDGGNIAPPYGLPPGGFGGTGGEGPG